MPNLREICFNDYRRLKRSDRIVRANWCYIHDYDPMLPDLLVPSEWVGKRARDCVATWQDFYVPISG